MSIAIICQNKDAQPWVEALKAAEEDLDIQVWPDIERPEAVQMALVWNHPAEAFTELSELKCISSMGAGVDQLIADSRIPAHCELVRIVDPNLASSMFDYLSAVVASIRHHLPLYRFKQQQKIWLPKDTLKPESLPIGVMGLGQLGSVITQSFADLSFPIKGWSASQKQIEGVKCYAGDEELKPFLSDVQVLINLLPLTPKTENILNYDNLSSLAKGAYLVNVGRGQHLVEADLIQLLSEQRLAGAYLDVFRQEPINKDHIFWENPQVQITPHVSSLTNPNSAAPQVVENYHRVRKGLPLLNSVDKKRGY